MISFEAIIRFAAFISERDQSSAYSSMKRKYPNVIVPRSFLEQFPCPYNSFNSIHEHIGESFC
jgi:hypothetical protein